MQFCALPKFLQIELGKSLSAHVPLVKVLQTYTQKCCLEGVQARVVAANRIEVLSWGTVVPQYPDALCQALIVRNDCARVPKGSQVLRWIETEARGIRQTSHRNPAKPGSVCLRRIFNDAKIMLVRELKDVIHGRRLAVEMYGYDCPRPGRQRASQGSRHRCCRWRETVPPELASPQHEKRLTMLR